VKVHWALPCRHIEPLPDNSYALMGVITDVYLVPELPGTLGVPLLVNLAGSHHEIDQEHHASVVVTGPDLEPVNDTLEARFHVAASPNAPPGWGSTFIFPLLAAFPIATYGNYYIDIRVDDQPPYSVPIIVREP
jgi:hypothetical protein